jgi:hypothetical protein
LASLRPSYTFLVLALHAGLILALTGIPLAPNFFFWDLCLYARDKTKVKWLSLVGISGYRLLRATYIRVFVMTELTAVLNRTL